MKDNTGLREYVKVEKSEASPSRGHLSWSRNLRRAGVEERMTKNTERERIPDMQGPNDAKP